MFQVTFIPLKCEAQGEIHFSRAHRSGIVSPMLATESNTPEMVVGVRGGGFLAMPPSFPGTVASGTKEE